MTLQEFCVRLGRTDLWARLDLWYEAFGAQSKSRLIQRNVDREFGVRDDLTAHKKLEFLEALADRWETLESDVATGSSRSYGDLGWWHPHRLAPWNVVTNLVNRRRRDFLLQGGELGRPATGYLYHYVELDLFTEWLTLPYATLAAPPNLDALAAAINRGEINGAHVASLGKGGFALWCTDDSLSTETDPRAVRNRLGLDHVRGGWLLEIRYPYRLIEEQGLALRAPTVLDACARGGDNWVFVKNHNTGGPDWGIALDLGVPEGGKGGPEAVHDVPDLRRVVDLAADLNLRAIGDIIGTQHVDFERILRNRVV